jgi:hypothetical protein
MTTSSSTSVNALRVFMGIRPVRGQGGPSEDSHQCGSACGGSSARSDRWRLLLNYKSTRKKRSSNGCFAEMDAPPARSSERRRRFCRGFSSRDGGWAHSTAGIATRFVTRRRQLGRGRAASGRRIDRGEQRERRCGGRPRGEWLRAFQQRPRHVRRLGLGKEGADRTVVAIEREGDRLWSRAGAVTMAATMVGGGLAVRRHRRRGGAVVCVPDEVVEAVP